jgi:hypothetical protein
MVVESKVVKGEGDSRPWEGDHTTTWKLLDLWTYYGYLFVSGLRKLYNLSAKSLEKPSRITRHDGYITQTYFLEERLRISRGGSKTIQRSLLFPRKRSPSSPHLDIHQPYHNRSPSPPAVLAAPPFILSAQPSSPPLSLLSPDSPPQA